MTLQKHIATLFLLPGALLFSTVTPPQKQGEGRSHQQVSSAEAANRMLVQNDFYSQLKTIMECDLEMNKGELISRESGNYGWVTEYYSFALPLPGFQMTLEKKQQNGGAPEWALKAYKSPATDNEQLYDSLFEKLKSYGSVTEQPASSFLFKGMQLSLDSVNIRHVLITLNKYSPYVAGGAEDNSITIYVAQRAKVHIGNNSNSESGTKSKKYVTCSSCNGKGHFGVIKNTQQKRYQYKKDAAGEYKYLGSTTTGVNDVCSKCMGKGRVYE